MNMNEHATAAVADPAERSCVYRLLADVFRYPSAERLEHFRGGDYLDDLLGALDSLPHARLAFEEQQSVREEIEDDLASLEFTDFETRYIITFDVGAPTSKVIM